MNGLSLQYYIYAENDSAGAFSPIRAEHEFHVINAKMPSPKLGELVINEFLASNGEGATDENDAHEDWIELYNTTNTSLDLYGVYLTDKYSSPQKFSFPEGTTIEPKGRLVLWADEDSTTSEYIHANFKLSSSGEQLLLSGSDGSVIDSVSFGAQLADVSMGRCPDGTGSFMSMDRPTFAKPNNCSVDVSDQPNTQQIVEVYPNPASSVLYIINSTAELKPYTLTNILGEVVRKGQMIGLSQLNLSDIEQGLYILSIADRRTSVVICHE
jgi:hypothetical protein